MFFIVWAFIWNKFTVMSLVKGLESNYYGTVLVYLMSILKSIDSKNPKCKYRWEFDN